MISYLLTCEKTKERLEVCISRLEAFSISPIIKNSNIDIDSKRSCFEGHLSILKDFLETKESHCLVMEDDCVLEEQIDYYFIESLEFDIFLLGGIEKEKGIVEKDFIRISKFLQTHCYIISRKAANFFVEHAKFHLMEEKIDHIDFYFSKIFKDIKAPKKFIAHQDKTFISKIPK